MTSASHGPRRAFHSPFHRKVSLSRDRCVLEKRKESFCCLHVVLPTISVRALPRDRRAGGGTACLTSPPEHAPALLHGCGAGTEQLVGLSSALTQAVYYYEVPSPSFHGVMWHAQYDARKPWQSTFTNLKPMSWGNVFCGMERAGEHWEYAKNTARGNSSGVCAGCVWAR